MSIIKSIPLYVFSLKKKEKENSSPMEFLKKKKKKHKYGNNRGKWAFALNF